MNQATAREKSVLLLREKTNQYWHFDNRKCCSRFCILDFQIGRGCALLLPHHVYLPITRKKSYFKLRYERWDRRLDSIPTRSGRADFRSWKNENERIESSKKCNFESKQNIRFRDRIAKLGSGSEWVSGWMNEWINILAYFKSLFQFWHPFMK